MDVLGRAGAAGLGPGSDWFEFPGGWRRSAAGAVLRVDSREVRLIKVYSWGKLGDRIALELLSTASPSTGSILKPNIESSLLKSTVLMAL